MTLLASYIWFIYGVEIALIYVALLFGYRLVRGSTGDTAIKGFIVAFVAFGVLIYGTAQHFKLERILTLINGLKDVLVITVIVVFQPEIRRAIVRLGGSRFVSRTYRVNEDAVHRVAEAVYRLSRDRVGALLAFEREVGLGDYAAKGTAVDAMAAPDLLMSVFTPGGPLHDGGVILRGARIVAAGCLFPLSDNMEVSKRLGTRHRAALGISEETDCVSVVVSEETGWVSVAVAGQLHQNLDAEEFESYLKSVLSSSAGDVPVRKAGRG